MGQIEAVGFDMDWTLAQYNEEFDLLAFEGSKVLLILLTFILLCYYTKYLLCSRFIKCITIF